MFVIIQTVSKSVKISESKEYLSVQITHLTGTKPYSVPAEQGGWSCPKMAASERRRRLRLAPSSLLIYIYGDDPLSLSLVRKTRVTQR